MPQPSRNLNNDSLTVTSAALRFIAYRPRSRAEVRTRLQLRFATHVIDQVLSSLEKQNLVNDYIFATLWKDHRDKFSPRSASAIKRELLRKGIARDLAEETVRQLDDRDSAYRAGHKLVQRLRNEDFHNFRHRILGYLQRRGFTLSLARDTATKLWDERQFENRTLPGNLGN